MMSSVGNPLLRIGSRGEPVKYLQSALNSAPSSSGPKLAVDGAFGAKTDAQVRLLQSLFRLAVDGIVGPMTWSTLPKPDGTGLAEDLLAETVAHKAEAAFLLHKIRTPQNETTSPVYSREIAAGEGIGPYDPSTSEFKAERDRRGGRALQKIFQAAGAHNDYIQRCPRITKEKETWWDTSGTINARNNFDLPAWCGIFCYSVFRSCGVPLGGGWLNHKQNLKSGAFRVIKYPEKPFRGCMGIETTSSLVHHFIVVDTDMRGVHSIDGNVHNQDFNQVSTIGRRYYDNTTIRNKGITFLFPTLETKSAA